MDALLDFIRDVLIEVIKCSPHIDNVRLRYEHIRMCVETIDKLKYHIEVNLGIENAHIETEVVDFILTFISDVSVKEILSVDTKKYMGCDGLVITTQNGYIVIMHSKKYEDLSINFTKVNAFDSSTIIEKQIMLSYTGTLTKINRVIYSDMNDGIQQHRIKLHEENKPYKIKE